MLNTTPLNKQVEQMLRQEILTGSLAPGQRIVVDELAATWNVSTMPIRDALRRLEAAGLVVVAPRKGVYVSTMDRQTFKEIFDIRIALECLAMETAADLIPETEIQRALEIFQEAKRRYEADGDISLLVEHDSLIHDTIIQYCGNQKLIELMETLQDLIIWSRSTVVERLSGSYIEALPEHLQILTALKNRDADAARKALHRHLKNAYIRADQNWNHSEHNSNPDTS